MISDRNMAGQREQQPRESIIEDGQPECVTVPACSRAEFLCVRPAEKIRQVHLAVGEQVDHGMPCFIHGCPGRRTQPEVNDSMGGSSEIDASEVAQNPTGFSAPAVTTATPLAWWRIAALNGPGPVANEASSSHRWTLTCGIAHCAPPSAYDS